MGRTSLALAPSNESIIYAVHALSASVGSGKITYSGRCCWPCYASQTTAIANTWETRVTNTRFQPAEHGSAHQPAGGVRGHLYDGKATYGNQGGYDNVIAVDPRIRILFGSGGIDIFRSRRWRTELGNRGFLAGGAPQLAHADFTSSSSLRATMARGTRLLSRVPMAASTRRQCPRATATGDRAACSPYPTQVAWTSLNNGYAVTQFYHGSTFPGRRRLYGWRAGQWHDPRLRLHGAESWTKLVGGDGGFSAIDRNDPNLIYVSSQGLTLSEISQRWSQLFYGVKGITEPTANFAFITPFQMDPGSSKRLYIGGRSLSRPRTGAKLGRGQRSGRFWRQRSNECNRHLPFDPDYVVFRYHAGYVYYSNAASSADRNPLDVLPTARRLPLTSRVRPNEPQIVYATYSQFKSISSQSHIYKSTDGGATWSGIDGVGSTSSQISLFSRFSSTPRIRNRFTSAAISGSSFRWMEATPGRVTIIRSQTQ